MAVSWLVVFGEKAHNFPEDLPEEREKFVSDALRLAEDVSKNRTFNTVQPLLNFWAAFSPSKEVRSRSMLWSVILNLMLQSGIGVGGLPKEWVDMWDSGFEFLLPRPIVHHLAYSDTEQNSEGCIMHIRKWEKLLVNPWEHSATIQFY